MRHTVLLIALWLTALSALANTQEQARLTQTFQAMLDMLQDGLPKDDWCMSFITDSSGIVTYVHPLSRDSGLKAGDVILRINGKEFRSYKKLPEGEYWMGQHQPGDELELQFANLEGVSSTSVQCLDGKRRIQALLQTARQGVNGEYFQCSLTSIKAENDIGPISSVAVVDSLCKLGEQGLSTNTMATMYEASKRSLQEGAYSEETLAEVRPTAETFIQILNQNGSHLALELQRLLLQVEKSSASYLNEVSAALKKRQEIDYSSGDWSTVARYAKPSTVLINSNEHGGHGSGFSIEGTNYIVTNHHVIDGVRGLQVVTADGTNHANVKVLRVSSLHDLALLEVPSLSLKGLKLAKGSVLTEGQPVAAIGAPLQTRLAGTFTTGIISLASVPGRNGVQTFQLDASTSAGNSGGPVINKRGEVIGVLVSKVEHVEGRIGYGISFAIHYRHVEDLLNMKIGHAPIFHKKPKASIPDRGTITPPAPTAPLPRRKVIIAASEIRHLLIAPPETFQSAPPFWKNVYLDCRSKLREQLREMGIQVTFEPRAKEIDSIAKMLIRGTLSPDCDVFGCDHDLDLKMELDIKNSEGRYIYTGTGTSTDDDIDDACEEVIEEALDDLEDVIEY